MMEKGKEVVFEQYRWIVRELDLGTKHPFPFNLGSHKSNKDIIMLIEFKSKFFQFYRICNV